MTGAGSPIHRREFLEGTAAAAFVTWLHGPAAMGQRALPESAAQPAEHAKVRRIVSLRLRTAAPLDLMKGFYNGKLGLTVVSEHDREVTFLAGETALTFVAAEPADGAPYYHFAFNIPQNKIRAARAWQLERTELIRFPPEQGDPDYPDDVRHFRHWNAHSVFFWDPAENLVEYIARHELSNEAAGGFTSADILYASEIGFAVEEADRPRVTRLLHDRLGFEAYPKGTDVWWAMGDAHGLALIFTSGLRRNFGRGFEFRVFPTQATLRGEKPEAGTLVIDGYPFEIIAAP